MKWATREMTWLLQTAVCSHLSGHSPLLHSNPLLICIKRSSRSSSRCHLLVLQRQPRLQPSHSHRKPNSLHYRNQFSNSSHCNRPSLCHPQTTSRSTTQRTWTCTRRPQPSLTQAYLHWISSNNRTLLQVSSNSSSNSSSSSSSSSAQPSKACPSSSLIHHRIVGAHQQWTLCSSSPSATSRPHQSRLLLHQKSQIQGD